MGKGHTRVPWLPAMAFQWILLVDSEPGNTVGWREDHSKLYICRSKSWFPSTQYVPNMSLKLTDWFQAKPYLWHTFGWLKWRVMSSKSTLMGPSNDCRHSYIVLACLVHRWRWGWRWDGDKNLVQANHDQPIANPSPSPSQVRAFDPVSATAVRQDEPGACDDQGDRDYFRYCTLPRVAISI